MLHISNNLNIYKQLILKNIYLLSLNALLGSMLAGPHPGESGSSSYRQSENGKHTTIWCANQHNHGTIDLFHKLG